MPELPELLTQRVYSPEDSADKSPHHIKSHTPKGFGNAFAVITSQATQPTSDQLNDTFAGETTMAINFSSRDQDIIKMSKQRPYIEPATPILPGFPIAPKKSFYKNRAVTEPIRESATVAPLFTSHKTKPSDAKKSRSSKDNKDLPALPPTTSAKAAAVLGESIPQAFTNKTPPPTPAASAPATTINFSRGPANTGSYVPQDSRQVRSTPGPPTLRFMENKQGQPTSRFYTENIPTSVFEIPSPPKFSPPPPPPPKLEGMILGDGRMSPTRGGTYGRLGNVNVMPPPPRMESMTGIIDHVGNIEGAAPNQYLQPAGLGLGYSPSVYGNGFDDPPPSASNQPYYHNAFRDQKLRQASSGDSHSLGISQGSQASKMTLPFVFNGHESELTPRENAPQSAAPTVIIPPYPTPLPPSTNTVPPHPSWIPSPSQYQADMLAHHVLNLHYQIGTETGGLRRNMDNKHHDVVDHIIRRYESAQAIQAEYQNDLRQGLSAVEHNLGRVVGEVNYLGSQVEEKMGSELRWGRDEARRRIENRPGPSASGETGMEATLEKLVRMGEVMMGKLDGLADRMAIVERRVENGSCASCARGSSAASTTGTYPHYQPSPQQAVSQGRSSNQSQKQYPTIVEEERSTMPENKYIAQGTNPVAYHPPQPQQHAAPEHVSPPKHSRPSSPERRLRLQNVLAATGRSRDTPDLRQHPAFAKFAFAEPKAGGVGYDAGQPKEAIDQEHWYQQVYERGA